MSEIELLKELFGESIIEIIKVFIENPSKDFSLSELSLKSKINITTTFRTINKLVEQDIIIMIPVGKTKLYRLKRSEKTASLSKMLKKGHDYIQEFINQISQIQRVKKIILESKEGNNAKIIIVGDFLVTDKIKEIASKSSLQFHAHIDFVVFSENQFQEMVNLNLYDLKRKIIWERDSQSHKSYY